MIEGRAVVVFGGRHPAEGDREYEEARRLGRLLAERGLVVMSGGYSGVMEAVSRGAAEAGGTVVGATMEIFGKLPPNRYLTREVRTRDFFHRLEFLVGTSSAFIVLRGGMGTLTELGLVWNMLQTRTLGAKRVILVGGFWRPMLENLVGPLVLSPSDLDLLHYVDGVDQAVALLGALGGATPGAAAGA